MSDDTHFACNARLKESGGSALCCHCEPHEGCKVINMLVRQMRIPTPSTNTDELQETIRHQLAELGVTSEFAVGVMVRVVTSHIQAHYLPKDKVRAAIGEDENDPTRNARWQTYRNELRHELKRALGLEED